MKKLFLLLPVAVIFMILCLSNFESSKAQNLVPDLNIESTREENFNKLIESAEQTGAVRVIVGVKIDFKVGDEFYLQNIDAMQEEIKKAQDEFTSQLSAYNLNPLKYKYIPYLAMNANADALQAMKNLPDVVSIEKDEMLKPSLAESVGMIGGITVWNAGYTGIGQTVAIIDSGVDKTHPMFQGKIVSEACYSAYDNVNAFAVCNGNFGPNPYPGPGEPSFMVATTTVNSGLPCNPNGFNSLIGDCAHGTHVAGIAAGRTPTFSGVARDSGIIAINAGSVIPVSGNYRVNYFNSAILLALERVFALRTIFNIASVNMSLGGNGYTTNCDSVSPSIKAAIDNLRSAGIATVIASGNESYINGTGFPACISSAVSVGSVNDGSTSGVYGTPTIADRISPFSNSASFLNLLAPGDGIISSVPAFASSTGYSNFGGTSQAAPHVAGSWAVLKQRNPNASVTTVLNNLANTGIPILDSRNNITKPRIRTDYALSIAGSTCVINPISIGQTLNGQNLSNSDCTFSDNLNRYFDYYTFNATAGQQIAISMNSSFDTYLSLRSSSGQILREDNNGGGGTNSRIPANTGFYTIPATGTYIILATSSLNNSVGTYSLTLSSNSSSPPLRRFCDFDGDGKSDVSIFRPSNGQWWINRSSTNQTVAAQFGTSSDKIVPADFTGDGKSDIALWRPSTGQWFIIRSEDSSFYAFPFGSFGDIPAPGDFDGDGKADAAVFRPSNATWYILRSSGGIIIQSFGVSNDVPVTADYDGDGKADIAIYRPAVGEWWILRSAAGLIAYQFGSSGDKAVQGDYTGDGKADVTVWRPSNGTWSILRSENNSFYAFPFGSSGDMPVPGDYDGDGKFDAAVFRPSNSTWYLQRSTAGFTAIGFGLPGDFPVPNAFVR